MTDIIPNDRKLRELILFVAKESEGDAPFGAVKQNKLLFYIDFNAYLQFGKPVTGHEYRKLQQGPVPRKLLPIMRSLKNGRECVIANRVYFGRTLKRTMALRDPDVSVFDAQEIYLAHSIIREFWGKDASEMTAISHKFIGWKVAEDDETIPYSVALVRRGSRSAQAENIAATLREKAKECLARER